MQLASADKNIVDRSKLHRNTDVPKAARLIRNAFSQQPGVGAFDSELLKLHARSTLNGAAAVPLFVITLAAGGFLIGLTTSVAIWAMMTVICYAFLGLIAKHYDALAIDAFDARRAKHLLLAGHFVSGLGWVYLVTLQCSECGIEQFPVIKAVILLLAAAATLLVASSLR
jgi:two-component system cell cycle sensor histidine kinase PleC